MIHFSGKDYKRTSPTWSVIAMSVLKSIKHSKKTPKLPTRPWSKVAVDEFHYKNKSYLLTVDYFSDYFEIDRLYSTTSKSIIKKLQAQFARHGIPEEVITDNNPNLVSDEFSKFATEWKFDHISISPGHSRSNGKVESAVAIVKTLMKKAERSNTNITKPYSNGETLLLSTCHQAQFKDSFQEEPKLFCQLIPS